MATEAEQQAVRSLIAEHLRISWGKLTLHFLYAVSWVIINFSHTENLLLRISAVIVAVVFVLLALNRRYMWRDHKVPYVDKAAGVVIVVCGIAYLMLGAHPPNVWFFGLGGSVLILSGFLLVLM